MGSPRLFRRVALMGLAFLAFEVTWLVVKIGGESGTTAFSDIVGIPSSFGATVACVWASRGERGRSRSSWLALAAACGSWGIGQTLWTYYELLRGDEVPFPGLPDAGFLGFIPFAVLAMLWLPTAPHGSAARMRALLDGLIIAGSVLFISWATVLAPTLDDAIGSLPARAIGLAYPVSDLAIIAIVLLVLGRARTRERFALALLAGGVLSIALADVGFAYLNLQELYSTGSLIDPLWDLGFVLIALAAIRRPRSADSLVDERRVGPASITAPYAPFFLAISMAIFLQVADGELEPFLFWCMIVIVLFMAARQLLALWDNLSLNHELEQRVGDRTAELETTLREVERSSQLKDEFIRNVTHELRTPLSIVLGSTHLLSRVQHLSPQAAATIALAERASLKVQAGVHGLLRASGLSAAAEEETTSSPRAA